MALMAGTLAAQSPSFTGVVNAASDIPPGFPNSGIAQGSIFVVYGSNLGPANLVEVSALPLPTTAGLAGTSITITVGDTAVTAPMIYTSAGQVAAIMPSATPVGNGTLTLTFNGNSGATPIQVVATAFGISTVNYSGSGQAVVTLANNTVISNTNSAAPGDELVMYGTGLGPLPADQSDTMGAVGTPLVAILTVFVGGVPATVLYQGRTPTATGLDQINFVVPANAPLGCSVPVTVLTNGPTGITSNSPVISLALRDGIACSDPTQLVPTSALSKSTFKAAFVGLKESAQLSYGSGTPPTSSTSTSYKAKAGFIQFSQTQLASQFAGLNTEPTLGTCLTGTLAGNGSAGGSGQPVGTYLDGGASVTLTPPSGSPLVIPSVSTGAYQTTSLTSIPSGSWSFSNGAGGAAVGPINFSFPIPAQVTWTNEISLSSGPPIDRTQGLTITWSGGDPNGFVDIAGQAQIGPAQNPTFSVYFDCAAPISVGQFTIPPAILLAMPTGANAFAGIQVSTVSFPASPQGVAGFDAVLDSSEFQVEAPVIFK
jgi:uncharacterized protein (TIGR03437 family)